MHAHGLANFRTHTRTVTRCEVYVNGVDSSSQTAGMPRVIFRHTCTAFGVRVIVRVLSLSSLPATCRRLSGQVRKVVRSSSNCQG